MIHPLLHLRRKLQLFWKDDSGNSTIEFAILAPIFLSILFAAVEIGVLSYKQVALDRGVDMTVRDLRLGKYSAPDADDLRDSICFYADVIISDCSSNLLLELRTVATDSWATLDPDATCVEYEDPIDPADEPVFAGGENELMLIRACALVDTVFPLSN
ncbi:MAG: TadE/TadG family type IV pilus assembly protein, partial [Pseudoruegeria sp.]